MEFRMPVSRLLLPWALAASSALTYADTGELLVTVVSEENRPLAGSTIMIESRTGEQRKTVADSSGRALVRDLRAGLYRVEAELRGFAPAVEPGVRVVRGKTVPVDMWLPRDRREAIDEMVVVADAMRRDAYGGVGSSYFDREHLRTATGSGADVLRALDGLPGLHSTGEFASFTVRGRGPRDNLILVDDFPYDKVVHFDLSLGEQEDISGGGRFSIFAPNLIEGAVSRRAVGAPPTADATARCSSWRSPKAIRARPPASDSTWPGRNSSTTARAVCMTARRSSRPYGDSTSDACSTPSARSTSDARS